MSERQETADAIIAEMNRVEVCADGKPYLRDYARRFDAAYKREVDALNEQITDLRQQRDLWSKRSAELVEKCNEQYAKLKQVGNAAKLREAAEKTRATLEEALQILNGISDEEAGTLNARLEDVADEICEVTQWIIPDALAAPPRNCDVGSAEEQEKRFHDFCRARHLPRMEDSSYCAYKCPLEGGTCCELQWAQMPYEEGGGR